MKFDELLETTGQLPLFRGGLLLAGDRDPASVRKQLSRWKATGRVIQLRRNLYTLAAPYRKVEPHPFLIANELLGPSYVSLESALAYYGHIPEAVPVTTSVTTGRTCSFDTPFGRFDFRHVRSSAFFGYHRIPVANGQDVLMARAPKALLDLVYLTSQGDSLSFLKTLRMEDIEALSKDELLEYADRWGKGKLRRAVVQIIAMMESEERDGGWS